jgi:hypothetical protein
MSGSLKLSDLKRCFQGVIPSIIATCDGRGVPNVTYLSQVYYVDEQHVALSCQFFNKTRRNLDENPLACVETYDPLTFEAYRLRLRFIRSEKSGPLFDAMALRIDAIASHTGMSGVFRLIAADVFEVRSFERIAGFQTRPTDAATEGTSREGYRTELRGLQWVSERINRATDLESLLQMVLEALDEYFGFAHSSVMLLDAATNRLVTMASRGFGKSGVGAEVAIGEGLIGIVARDQRVLRLTTLEADLRYGRAIRREASRGDTRKLDAEIPLPGLPDAQSVLAIPLAVGDRLIGVLAAEDRDPMRFGEWHEAYLEIIGNQIAVVVDRMLSRADDSEAPESAGSRSLAAAGAHPAGPRETAPSHETAASRDIAATRDAAAPASAAASAPAGSRRRFTYYRTDDAIFVDDEYLIRNVPARILWKVLTEAQRGGRTEFSNREMRLDPALGLPPVKDNFESRLILLRQRLREKCPDLQLVSTGRGRFGLRTSARIEMVER